jgi:hypothetical protein
VADTNQTHNGAHSFKEDILWLSPVFNASASDAPPRGDSIWVPDLFLI